MDLCTLTTVLLLALPACSRPHQIDEEYAASVVKHELSLQGSVTAKEMHDGYSGAKLFLASSDSQKFVIKFGSSGREIYNSTVASDGGYGPKVYFADPSKSIMIMEFLPGKITLEDLQSDQLYIALAHLLQKIHQGMPLKGGSDVPRFIRQQIEKNKSSPLPIAKMEEIFTQILATLQPHLTKAPCHNDLWSGNLMYNENKCKAIDWADAGESDPFYDVACVVNEIAFQNPLHENLLFRTYLGHTPSSAESAKLYLMKQVVWIKWICNTFKFFTSEDLQKYESLSAPPFTELRKAIMEGRFKENTPTNRLINLKSMCIFLFQNVESQEFKDAVHVLNSVH